MDGINYAYADPGGDSDEAEQIKNIVDYVGNDVQLKESFFDYQAHDLDGNPVSTRDLCKDAKATMVVNVASL